MAEYMDIVDDNDVVIGKTTQEEIYSKKLTHRIVHVMVVNPKTNKIYFQKRSEKKDFLPGFYCTSAGGHVQSGETYEQAAVRELKEEIGLSTPLKKATDLTYSVKNHKRLIRLFITYAQNGFNFEDGEVASGEFLDFEKANAIIRKDEKIHPQLYICFKWFCDNKEKYLKYKSL
jgi:isopentenyldiphosphate isomerase